MKNVRIMASLVKGISFVIRSIKRDKGNGGEFPFFTCNKILDLMHNFCLLKSWNECNTFKMASSKENKVYETILTSEHSAAE